MNVTKMLLICFALAMPLSCGDDDSGTPDVTGDDGGDVAADADADVTPEVEADVPEETGETPTCSADQTDNFVNLAGLVTPLGGTDAGGLFLAAADPISALVGTPTILATTTTNADGTWHMDCVDVTDVAIGLIVMADDDPADGVAGDFFPTLTGVTAWDTEGYADKLEAPVFALTNTLSGGIAALTGIDPEGDGIVMGIVVDGTHAPLAGATIERSGAGTPLTFAYPTADFTGLMDPAATSASGIWVMTDVLTGLTNVTATLAPHTFDIHPAANVAGNCYFLPFIATE
ncbi:MAG: hypothetical protein HY905_02760 [Deltaproteobacteria bacterium]|nr:hypothetical protein [Deltaproteobacteria bacterium]